MRLFASNPAESLEAVRALSEGSAPKRVLLAVPFVPFTPVRPKDIRPWEEPIVIRTTTHVADKRHRAGDQLAAYRATRPGRFLSSDFAEFSGLSPILATSRLIKYARDGKVTREGKRGRQVIWKFA